MERSNVKYRRGKGFVGLFGEAAARFSSPVRAKHSGNNLSLKP